MILVILGGTCSGKTTFAHICEKYGFPRVITNTTRPRRVDDTDMSYNFISTSEFESKISNGSMLEYTIYNGNYYGVSIDSLSTNCVVVLDPVGYKSLKKIMPNDVYGIYLDISEDTRLCRGISRGDNVTTLLDRFSDDRKLFTKSFKESVSLIISEDMSMDLESVLKSNLSTFFTKS